MWYNHKELDAVYLNDKNENIYLLFELTEFILHFIGISDTITLKKMLEKKRKEFNNATKQQTDRTIKGQQMLAKLTDYFENKRTRYNNEK